MSARKVIASSFERYNGGASVKRAYGSSTITRFYVFWAEDEVHPGKWEVIEAMGRTPGERKTFAIEEFRRRRS